MAVLIAALAHHRAAFLDCLHAYCAKFHRRTLPLDAAMRYALLGEGKRLRPLLLLASTEALGGDVRLALRPALALELLHTWSLIHDDLPCMDDDDERRGQATVHKKFGEADALLAGDALLSDAFYLLSSTTSLCAEEKWLALPSRLRLVTLFARAVGSRGIVYGQHRDLHAQHLQRNELVAVQRAKTGWLFAAACAAGAIVAGHTQVARFVKLGHQIGLVFQISDDIFDGEQRGASWLALTTVAQAQDVATMQMHKIRKTLQQLRLADSNLAQFIDTLTQRLL